MLYLQDMQVFGKRVLMRVDFNVPLDPAGLIVDDTRIKETLPSIRYLLDHGAAVILLSHLGRPKGKKNEALSLRPCAVRLQALLGKPVRFVEDFEKMTPPVPGEVVLLENMRFYPAEEAPEKDPSFAERLALLGDLYVNDAFGTVHRRHSSTADIARFFKGACAAGLLMEKEIKNLSCLLHNPPSPFYAIIGGSKVSGKLGVLRELVKRADGLFIGGAMAYTFLAAQGIPIGDSPCEKELFEEALTLMRLCKKLYLPEDIVVADAFRVDAEHKVVSSVEGIAPGWQGVDIGPKTVDVWKGAMQDAQLVFWNGPVGVYEMPPFAKGTEAVAHMLSQLSCHKIVGGGDSVAAIHALHLESHFSHLSTGGGAALEYIEKQGALPGLLALEAASQT